MKSEAALCYTGCRIGVNSSPRLSTVLAFQEMGNIVLCTRYSYRVRCETARTRSAASALGGHGPFVLDLPIEPVDQYLAAVAVYQFVSCLGDRPGLGSGVRFGCPATGSEYFPATVRTTARHNMTLRQNSLPRSSNTVAATWVYPALVRGTHQVLSSLGAARGWDRGCPEARVGSLDAWEEEALVVRLATFGAGSDPHAPGQP